MRGVRNQRLVCLVALVFALLAGPVEAACSSCCPTLPERTLGIGPAGCCADQCGVTIERADADRAAVNVPRACLDSAAVDAVVTSPLVDGQPAALAPAAFDLSPSVFSSHLSPLRL
jgi:hypothetical protein